MKRDIDHLNLLAIFHFVMAGMNGLFGLLALAYCVMGIFMLNAPPQANSQVSMAGLGTMMITLGGVGTVVMLVLTVISAAAGRCLFAQKARMFCYVNAAVQLTQVPLGTVLGVFTALVLSRPSVEALFAGTLRHNDPEDEVYDPVPMPDAPTMPGDERFFKQREGE